MRYGEERCRGKMSPCTDKCSKDSSGRGVISTFLSGITALECNDFVDMNHWQAASATLQCYPKCSAQTGHHWPRTGYCQCLGRREFFVRVWHYLARPPFLFLCSKTLLMKEAVQLHSSSKTRPVLWVAQLYKLTLGCTSDSLPLIWLPETPAHLLDHLAPISGAWQYLMQQPSKS